MRTFKVTLALTLAIGVIGALTSAATSVVPPPTIAPMSSAAPLPTVASLLTKASARVPGTARVPLADENAQALEARLRLNGATTPNYVRALKQMPPQAGPALAEALYAFLYRGTLPTGMKAAMGVRIAQVNDSPYVAAHMARVLRASSGRGSKALAALDGPASRDDGLNEPERLAVRYAEQLTRNVHGVSPEDFAGTRAVFNDSEVVELTLTVSFFNYFTRYAEGLRLPVEKWAVDGALAANGTAPPPAANDGWRPSQPRIALISDEEMAATQAALAAAKDPAQQSRSLGLGMANSQRAMLRVPTITLPWRAYGTAVREKEAIGRDIKLHVSFAVSVLNDCRYCTLHQVLGLRRLGVDPAKLMAMRKDDSALTPRELVAVRFARALTTRPGAVTDAEYDSLKQEFGEVGAQELLIQTCNFAFMNRFTDGLMLPSEDEAIRVYQEIYGPSSTR
jgi:AhpD family alkylhydroperoxidase